MVIFTVIYLLASKMYQPTWSGWSVAAFYDWGMFMKLAIPGTFMVSLDVFVYELGVIFSGRWRERLCNAHLAIMLKNGRKLSNTDHAHMDGVICHLFKYFSWHHTIQEPFTSLYINLLALHSKHVYILISLHLVLFYFILFFTLAFLGDEYVSALAIIFQLALVMFQCHLGAGIATCIQVGQHLGARDGVSARQSAITAYSFTSKHTLLIFRLTSPALYNHKIHVIRYDYVKYVITFSHI